MLDSEKVPDLRLLMGSHRILLDVSICHPLAPNYIGSSGQFPLGVAKGTETRKCRKYEAEANRAGFAFVPFILETTGGWGPRAITLVHQLAKFAKDHHAMPKHEALNLLAQGISTAVQFGNAQLILGGYQNSVSVSLAGHRRGLGPYAPGAPLLVTQHLPLLPDLTGLT